MEIVLEQSRRSWEGHLESALDALRARPEEECCIAQAALLIRHNRFAEASEVAEKLQNCRRVAGRVLCAVVVFEWEEKTTCMDMLYKVKDMLRSSSLLSMKGLPLTLEESAYWNCRILSLLVACDASSGKYTEAIKRCQEAMVDLGATCWFGIHLELVRLSVQVGDIEGARKFLLRLDSIVESGSVIRVDANALQIARGIVEFADSKYNVAYRIFEQMISDLESVEIEDAYFENVFDMQIPPEVTACNNLALCSLNLCDLNGAILLIEQCIKKNPRTNLHPSLVFNLCTLYDLARSREESRLAKESLQRLAEKMGISSRFDAKTDLRM